MYVVPDGPRRGPARTMLAHLERTAAEAGAEAMILETGTAQPEAIALYESSGYTAIPSFGHYKDEPLNRCYAKSLGALPCRLTETWKLLMGIFGQSSNDVCAGPGRPRRAQGAGGQARVRGGLAAGPGRALTTWRRAVRR